MKKSILAGILFLMGLSVFSQTRYVKGFITDNDRRVTSCLILDEGWMNNPVKFTYKFSETDAAKKGTVSIVSAFSLEGGPRYERHSVNLDRSYPDSRGLSYSRAPKWTKEILFLELLVQGKATLYQYRNGNDLKFFYRTDQDTVKQLLFREYKTMDEMISKNITYVNQLFKEVNCLDKSIDQLKQIGYNEKDLRAYFIENNQCSEPDYNVETATYQSGKGDLNIKPYAGVAFSSLSVYNTQGNEEYNIDFDNKTGVKLGVEFEYVFSFDKNKWSILLDMNYISYQASFEKEISGAYSTVHLKAEADLKALQFPFGIRYYVFFNNDSKIYFNAGFNYAVFMDSRVFISGTGDLDIESSKGMFGGIGYTFKNKYTLDLSYQNGDIFNTYLYRDSNYKVLSLNFKYTIF